MTRDDPPSPSIPDYELLREIGRGSYGTVWIARSVTGLFRAIKIVWRASFPDPVPYEREFRGLKEFAAVSLTEPRLLALLHVGRNDAAGFFYYIMELADDAETRSEIDPARYVPMTLRELRRRRGRLTAAETLSLGVELANALAGLHDHNLVHRDIKPSNIIFVANVPKLADIGLVTSAATADESRSRVGNIGYMPPDFPGVAAADVFGLGKVLYELVTGRDHNDYPRLPANMDTFADRKELLELNEILIRACAPDARQRYEDAGALLGELRLLHAGKSVRRLRAAEQHLSRALRAAALLGIAAGIASVGAWIEHRRAAKAEAERDAFRQRATYSANLARAQRANDSDELMRARQFLLNAAPKPGEPDLRGFEWRALWRTAQGDPHTAIRTEGHEIVTMALSHDESLLAVHDSGDVVTLYSASSLREHLRVTGIRTLGGLSRDGRWICGADSDGKTRRWSVETGEPEPNALAVIGKPIGVAADDTLIAITGGSQAELKVWDWGQRRVTRQVALGGTNPNAAWGLFRSAVSKDGQWIVQAWHLGTGSSTQFRVSCIRLGPEVSVVDWECGRAVPTAVGVDQRGPWVFFDGKEGRAAGEIWRCPSRAWEKSPETLPRGSRKYVDFDRPPGRSAVIGRMHQVAWLEGGPGELVARVGRGHNALINTLVVSERNRSVFSGATDGSLLKWELDAQPPKHHVGWDSLGGTTNVVFTPDAKAVWTPHDGRSCVLLDTATLTPIARAEGMVYPVAISAGSLVGVGCEPGLLRVKAGSGEFEERFMVSTAAARAVALSADGRQIAVIDHAGNLLALSRDGPRQLRQRLDRYYRILMDERGERLWMAASTARELVCISWPDGIDQWRVNLPALASDFALLPDQKQMIIALENGSLELRTVETGRMVKRFDSGSAAPQTLAIFPAGDRLFVAGMEGAIHHLALTSWEQIHTMPIGRDQYLHKMVCSPDGNSLAVLTRSGVLHLVRAK